YQAFLILTTTVTSAFFTSSLHDALPIFLIDNLIFRQLSGGDVGDKPFDHEISILKKLTDPRIQRQPDDFSVFSGGFYFEIFHFRSEEHTSELQSRENLVCRLLLEKKKIK